MTTESWQEICGILEGAIERPPGEREAYLEAACGGDASLRGEVDAYLAADRRDAAVVDVPAWSIHTPDPRIGHRAGPFRILRLLGRGGMGAVYLAQREDEYRQQVALKLIQSGRDSEEILRRFRTERQILAQLEHPNIPRILDGGSTAEGLPYFAMEYVDGVPVDRYCDQQGLDLRRRLELFRRICAAVDFSHQNLVIHRDLKPGNILVTGDGVPKLLDFGIAKLLPTRETSLTVGTGLPMTMHYASPEQLRGAPVSTRSDVYSLGVLLYVLLTGRHPYRVARQAPAELVRAVCEQEPAPPSTVAGAPSAGIDSEDRRSEPAAGHGRGARKLRRRLAGDLDSIVAKAMRKEPEHRYGSVEQLAEDLRRHLAGLPVLARRGSFSYRASRFVRRNKLAAAVLALILGFSINTVLLWRRAVDERDQAILERQRAQEITGLLKRVLRSADPDEARGREVTVREILDRSREEIATSLDTEAEVRVEMFTVMGGVYRDLDLPGEARGLFEQALEILRRLHPAAHPELAKGLDNLGGQLLRLGEYGAAEELFCESLALRRQLADEGSEIARTMSNLALILRDRGELEQAEALYREGLRLRLALYGLDSRYVASSFYGLGVLRSRQGRSRAAERLLRRALEIRRQGLGEEHTRTASVKSSLGRVLQARGDLGGAEELFRQALKARRHRLGDAHVDVARSRRDLAAIRLARGDAEAALGMLGPVLDTITWLKPPGDWEIADTQSLRGACLVGLRRFSAAEPVLLGTYRRLREVRGDRDFHTRAARHRIVALYAAWGRPGEAGEYRVPGLSPASAGAQSACPCAGILPSVSPAKPQRPSPG